MSFLSDSWLFRPQIAVNSFFISLRLLIEATAR